MPLMMIAVINPDLYGVVDTATHYKIVAGMALVFIVIALAMHLMGRSKR